MARSILSFSPNSSNDFILKILRPKIFKLGNVCCSQKLPLVCFLFLSYGCMSIVYTLVSFCLKPILRYKALAATRAGFDVSPTL